MELTDTLYSQISSYVDGDMKAIEKEAFETRMKVDEELLTEVKLYKEIQAICESADKKIKNYTLMQEPEKNKMESEAWKMITKARQDWEAENSKKVQAGKIFIEQQQVKKPHTAKVIAMQRWTMVAAAIILGIICLSGLWWYLQYKPIAADTAVNKKLDTQPATANKSAIKPAEAFPVTPDSASHTAPLSPANNTTTPTINSQELFAASFKPDEAPKDKDASLEEPLNFYTARAYNDAIETFEMTKVALDTRAEGRQANSTLFYIHYYLAMSYMAAGSHIQNAIAELKSAIGLSPDNYLKSKAQWYLALAYIKAGNLKEAESLLQQLAANRKAETYQKKAGDLLHKILP